MRRFSNREAAIRYLARVGAGLSLLLYAVHQLELPLAVTLQAVIGGPDAQQVGGGTRQHSAAAAFRLVLCRTAGQQGSSTTVLSSHALRLVFHRCVVQRLRLLAIAGLCLISGFEKKEVFPWSRCWALLAFNSLFTTHSTAQDPRNTAVGLAKSSTMRCMLPTRRRVGKTNPRPADSTASLPVPPLIATSLASSSVARRSGHGSGVLAEALDPDSDIVRAPLPLGFKDLAARFGPPAPPEVSEARRTSIQTFDATLLQDPFTGPAATKALTQVQQRAETSSGQPASSAHAALTS